MTIVAHYAEALVEAIPVEHPLKPKEESERWRMLQLIKFLENVALAGRDEEELNSAEVAYLEALIGTHHDRAATWAQNLLCFLYDKCRAPLTGGDATPRSLPYTTPGVVEARKPVLHLHPNRATAWVALDHDLLAEPQDAFIAVTDATGREVARMKVTTSIGQVIMDTRPLAPGTYTAELMNNGTRLGTEKFVVQP